MTARGRHRRRTTAASGRTYIVCGLRRRVPPAEAVVTRAGAIVAWLSGATLLLVMSLSVYAVARPPALRREAAVTPVARYTFADFVNLAR